MSDERTSRDPTTKRRKNEYTNIYKDASSTKDDVLPKFADPQFSFEINRSHRQMGHYFDTSQYSFEKKCDDKAQEQPKVTKKDIERFKRRKIEKKKMKNNWLYD